MKKEPFVHVLLFECPQCESPVCSAKKMIRAGVIDMEVGLSYATNAGNLRLLLVDLLDPQGSTPAVMKRREEPFGKVAKVEKTEVSSYE